MIRWAKTGGKRFYVISLTGVTINPASWHSQHMSTSYSVCDRDNCHIEVANYFPSGRKWSSKRCEQAANALADQLNLEEQRWIARQAAMSDGSRHPSRVGQSTRPKSVRGPK